MHCPDNVSDTSNYWITDAVSVVFNDSFEIVWTYAADFAIVIAGLVHCTWILVGAIVMIDGTIRKDPADDKFMLEQGISNSRWRYDQYT